MNKLTKGDRKIKNIVQVVKLYVLVSFKIFILFYFLVVLGISQRMRAFRMLRIVKVGLGIGPS